MNNLKRARLRDVPVGCKFGTRDDINEMLLTRTEKGYSTTFGNYEMTLANKDILVYYQDNSARYEDNDLKWV